MADKNPWFLVMTPDDANRPESLWLRRGAASHGKLSVLPIAPEGWIVLAVFVIALTLVEIAIWVGAFWSGALSLAAALVATVLAVGLIVLAVILIVHAKMTRLPPADQPR